MKDRNPQPPVAVAPVPPSECALCLREVDLTFHHLIPRAVHRKPRFQKRFTKQEMKQDGIWICELCHEGIHKLIRDEKDLADLYYTKELLLAHEGVARHVAWVRKQK